MIKLSSFILVLGLLGASAEFITVNRNDRADEGVISNFRVVSSTLNSITLGWDFVQNEGTLLKFSIVRDGFLNYDDLCTKPSCTFTVPQLEACSTYGFDIYATLNVDGAGVVLSNTESTSGATEGSVPGEITGISESNGVLVWDKEGCSAEYEVCVEIRGSIDPPKCETIQEQTYNLGELQLCAIYDIHISGKTSEGLQGDDSTFTIESPDGEPGPVINVEVIYIGKTVITVGFDDPIVNPLCAKGFGLSIVESRKVVYVPSVNDGHRHELNATGLHPCSNITLGVYATNSNLESSEYVYLNTATAEAAPSPPLDLDVQAKSDGTYEVTWVTDPGDNCAYIYDFCFISEDGNEDCKMSEEDDTMILSDQVTKCMSYELVVVPESPTGIPGDAIIINIPPIDARPGLVTNYTLEVVSSTEITVSYNDPLVNPDCVAGFQQFAKNLNETASDVQPFFDHSETIMNLEPCCTYQITTKPISLTGIQGPTAIDMATLMEDIPSIPLKLEWLVDQSSETALYIKWWRPAHAKFCVNHYTVKYSGGGVDKEIDVMNDGSIFEIRYLLEDLAPCTDYTIEIVAVTPAGSISEAAPLSAKTLGC